MSLIPHWLVSAACLVIAYSQEYNRGLVFLSMQGSCNPARELLQPQPEGMLEYCHTNSAQGYICPLPNPAISKTGTTQTFSHCVLDLFFQVLFS